MKYTIRLAFSNINLLNAKRRHYEYFNKLIFKNNQVTKIMFSVVVNFCKLKGSEDNYRLIEKECLATKDDFFVKDTKNALARLNFSRFNQRRISIDVDFDFDLHYLYYLIIEPLVIIWSANNGVLFLHASSVADSKGNALVFSAWRNTGKTNMVIHLCKSGYKFISDDYSIIHHNQVYLYPKALNLFSYNLKDFPEVSSKLGRMSSLKISLLILFKNTLLWLSGMLSGGISKVFYRLSELAEASTNIKITPEKLLVPVKNQAKLKNIYILQKTNSVKITQEVITAQVATEKIVEITKYELNDFYKIYTRYCFLFPGRRQKLIDDFPTIFGSLVRGCLSKPKLILTPHDFGVRFDIKSLLKLIE